MVHYFTDILGFDWDVGNRDKNFIKHQVSNSACEQIFFNEPLVIFSDSQHSQAERQYVAFGRTDEDRKLTVIFTLRGKLIRVISARKMSKVERKFYEERSQYVA